MPKVSIVTGYHNRASLLERTIKSAMMQDYDDYELVLFDDASTDGTSNILSEMSEKYGQEKFRYWIHPENIGFVSGLINAIACTDSEYIAIHGSGDASLPERLKLQAQYLDQNPDIGVVGGWYYNVSTEIRSERLRTPNANGATHQTFLDRNLFSHGEVMIRRSVYESVGGYRPEFTFAQDLDLWLRIARVSSFGTVPRPIYKRYIQFDGVSYDPTKMIRQSQYAALARDMSQLDPEAEKLVLLSMRSGDLDSLIAKDDSRVQNAVVKGVVRAVMFGNSANAEQLADCGITNRWIRTAFVRGARAAAKPAFSPLIGLGRKILKIS